MKKVFLVLIVAWIGCSTAQPQDTLLVVRDVPGIDVQERSWLLEEYGEER